MSHRKRITTWLASAGALSIPFLYYVYVGLQTWDRIFSFVILLYFLGFALAGLNGRHRQGAIPPGRVIAVVPAYNEEPELLHACVRSLLNGTLVPDVIHVVDDGSASPLPPFEHPRVVWHKRENGGKHKAQSTALLAELERFDFVVTVDSDSVVHRKAVERCLRAMEKPTIMGVTGVVYALNRARNLITRVTDLHYVHSCLVVRNALSTAGDIFTASGALAVWRSEVVMDNLNEYLHREVADDRHLTHFAQRRGQTKAVSDAYVYTNVPDNAPDLFRQRIRWARDYYKCTVLDIKYLSGWSFWMRTTDFALMSVAPVFAITALMVFPFAQWEVPWVGVGLWIAFLYAQTYCYVRERRSVPLSERLTVWLTLTPALYMFQLIVVGPAMVVALLNLRNKSWQTRNAKDQPAVTARAGQGRSLYLDSLRALAMTRVVVWHATGLQIWWLAFAFPSMGVMFALAGSLMASSLAKSKDRPEVVVWGRIRRLMPAVWGLAAALIPVMMIMGWGEDDARPLSYPAIFAWIFPLSDPPSNDWASPIVGVLWYVRTYLWLALISPALWAMFRRWPTLTAVAPAVLVAVAPLVTVSGWLSDVLLTIGVYAPCWVLGFWHATGRLQRLRAAVAYPVAAALAGGAVLWMQLFPAESLQASPPAQLMWCLAFVLVLFRFNPRLTWVEALKPLHWLIRRMNARAVTIYLWHLVAILTTLAIIDRARLFTRIGVVPTYCVMVVLIVAFIVLACWLMGWVEDLNSPKRRGTPQPGLGRHNAEVASALYPEPKLGQTEILTAPHLAAHVTQRMPAPLQATPQAHRQAPRPVWPPPAPPVRVPSGDGAPLYVPPAQTAGSRPPQPWIGG